MKSLLCCDIIYSSCHLIIKLILLLSFNYKNVLSKCTLDKQDIQCFGSTWKPDLLPIENNSLEKLYISRCTESKTQSETVDINFLRNVSKLIVFSMTNCGLIRPPIVNYQINSIEFIDLSNNLIDTNAQFPVLGLDFFKQFPNLKVLNLTGNRLTHLPKSWFDCPSKLETIVLDGNLIAGLNPSLASCFIHLKYLSLRGNLFERLRMPTESRKLFNGAYNKDPGDLKLFSDQNTLIRQGPRNSGSKGDKVSRGRQDYLGVFPKFKSLESLDLSQNRINSIDQIPLSNLESLCKLNMSYNRLSVNVLSAIQEVGCDFGTAPFYINGKSGITDLDLSGNKGLTKIHSCWTFGLQNLQYLRIANCSLTSIYDLSFDKMKTLTLLDLSHNKFSTVPKEVTVVAKSLTWLSFAYNNLSQMTSSHLSSLENLRSLNLSHNEFESLMGFPVPESENKFQDSIFDFATVNRDPSNDEPIHILSQMKLLQRVDLSFNNLKKVSAILDLPPSMKFNGELESVDLRGNPSMTQFIDFNVNDITTALRDFLVDGNLKLHCDCNILGFIKWIHQRQMEVLGRCSSPKAVSEISILDPQLIRLVLSNNSCVDAISSSVTKATYRLKLSYNANVSVDSSKLDDDPMDDGKKNSGNQKRQLDYQKWVMLGNNLTLRCEFFSTYPIPGSISIEWQRLKTKPLDHSYVSSSDNQQSLNIFLGGDKTEPLEPVKYSEKIELLSSNYDPRIKTAQIGPVDEDTLIDSWLVIEPRKSTAPLHIASTYKYVGFFLLKPVFLSDIGRYRCLVNGLPAIGLYGQNQLMSKEENIKVFTPPRFTTIPSTLIAILEGDTVEITCRAVGNPSPMTSLSKVGSKDFPAAKSRRMRIYKDDSSFFITSVRQVDAGNYSCTSRNIAGIISYNFTLKVQMPATILNKNQPRKTIRAGEPLIIGFKVDGVPSPDVKWFKDDRVILESQRVRFSSDELMLVIQSTMVSDAGVYKISIMNALGGNVAAVSVVVLDSPTPPSTIKDKTRLSRLDKDPTWMPDYWLSGIIITVILSMLITSILWIVIFFCCSKIMGSKKRQLLLISNSQSRTSFDKPLNTVTTSFSNPRLCVRSMFRPLGDCSIPLSLTTSTLVPHDQSQDSVDINTFTGTMLKSSASSDFYSSQLFHGRVSYSRSGIDLSTNRISEPCDSGIDSSQVYSETLNSASTYQHDHQKHRYHQHKSKHRSGSQKQRKRYVCSTSSEGSEVLKLSTAAESPQNGPDNGRGDEDTMPTHYLVQLPIS